MGQPGAKQGDDVMGIDTHIVMIPSPAGPVPTPLPLPFTGKLDNLLAGSVFIDSKAAATKGSMASNFPPHVPPGGPFQKPPTNTATIKTGSSSVFFDNKQAARAGDTADTCNDPQAAPNGVIVAASTVLIG